MLRAIWATTAQPACIELAITASELHDTDHVERDDTTIATCPDADRLLLPRAGITVDPARLTPDTARHHALGTKRLVMPEADDPLAWVSSGSWPHD